MVCYDANSAPVRFAAEQLTAALRKAGADVSTLGLSEAKDPAPSRHILLMTADDMGPGKSPDVPSAPESYAISPGRDRTTLAVGRDATGAMYAGLRLAEVVELKGSLPEDFTERRSPAIAHRGVKFNIPLDARTPSYDDSGDAAQANIANMWDITFWRAQFDAMAKARYDTLTLWCPHPFPSMVECPDYPDVALDDVCVSTMPLDHSVDRDDRRQLGPKDLKVVRKMTIDEKIAFWRRVMSMARDRGIDVYIITWNVYVDAAEGKYGITHSQDNPKTIAYLRQSVAQMIRTYPLLAGIGTTAGERMRNRKDQFSKERWLWATYGLGVTDAVKSPSGRHVRFIHRVWQTDLSPIVRDFSSKYPDSFTVSFKYARAHMYSSTKPPFVDKLCRQLADHKMHCWWNLRNDDIFTFRWGDPNYVRDFLSNLPPATITAGYYVGSDGYVWGRTFNDVDPSRRGRMEIDKHWYRFMLWGRLGYDPTLKRPFFEKLIGYRLDATDAQAAVLYEAWRRASEIIPLVNRFHWRDWDFMWAVEGCMDQHKGFHTVEDFIKTKPMPGSGMVSITKYADAVTVGQKPTGITPPQVAGELADFARSARQAAARARQAGPVRSVELQDTLADIEALALLGDYYADKILGATDLAICRRTHDATRRASAIAHLQQAAEALQGLRGQRVQTLSAATACPDPRTGLPGNGGPGQKGY